MSDKRHNSTTLKKAAMLEALEKTLGVVTSAAKLAGIERTTHYTWMNDDAEYKAAVDELENVTIDFVEAKLHKLVEDMNPTAVIFYLKTKGKKRGYIEQNDVNLSGLIQIIEKLKSTDFE